MRIDFSQIEQEQLQNQSTTSIFSTSLHETWKDNKNRYMQNEQEQSCLSFQVNYPYEVNRSVSPSAIKNEVSYLRANKILPASTLRFIKQSLTSEVQNNKLKEHSESSLFYEQPQQKQQIKNEAKILNNSQMNTLIGLQRKKRVKQKYQNIKPKVYDVKDSTISKNFYEKSYDLQNVTLRPILNYTLNSKITKKINQKRNNLYKTYKTNVFQSLYQNAGVYQIKKDNKRNQNAKQSKLNKKSSRININSTFQERLQKSIQKQGLRKKKAQNKLEYDLSTGQSLFTPDTSRSKISFLTHFKSFKDITQIQQGYGNHSCRLNHSQQIITTENGSLSKQLKKSLQSKYPLLRKTLPKQKKIVEIYTTLLWKKDHISHQKLEAEQQKVLDTFLEHINIINSSSNFISKQMFTAYFKHFYLNLNLFDKAILQNRIKLKQQKEDNKSIYKQPKGLKSKISFPSKLDHTYKHFYV